MIKIVGYINGRFVCDVMLDTPANRNLIKFALSCGLCGAISRI